MKSSIKILIAYILLFFVSSCTKYDSPPNLFYGKLKTIKINNDAALYLEYDSTNGNLIRVKNDSLHLEIKFGSLINNEIVIRNNSTSQQIIVRISATKNIESVILLDTLTAIQKLYFSAHYSNNNIDTTTEYGDVFVSNIQNYTFISDSFNYLKNNLSWQVSDFSGGTISYEDTVIYTFNPQIYDAYLPLQKPIQSIGYALSGNVFEDPSALNLLELNGINIFKKNKNLIQSVKSANYGYITNLSYVLNTLNQVIEMNVSNPDGTGTYLTYRMTYYE